MQKTISLIIVLFLSGCSSLFFYPDRVVYSNPSEFGFKYDTYKIASKDKTLLDAWHVKPSEKSKGLVILAHGNAQNMTAHFKGWTWLIEAGYELFIFDYRAYGKSEGENSIEGSVNDVNAVLDFIDNRFKKSYFVVGQSLGGTLSLAALHQKPRPLVKAMVIDSTFTSFATIASEKMGHFFLTWPFKWIPSLTLPDQFDAIDTVQMIRKPILFLHGSRDVTIPANHSWQLFDLSARPKEFWIVTQAKHIQAFYHVKIRRDFLTFLKRVDAGSFYHKDYTSMKIYH